MRLVLYQPDIAQNVGAAIRTAACFDAALDIIGPCGFPMSAKEINRVAMDYRLLNEPTVHDSWPKFLESEARRSGRLILLTTRAEQSLWDMSLQEDDLLMIGRESVGAPEEVHAAVDERARIEIAADARSLNMAVAAAVALSEARRQTGWST